MISLLNLGAPDQTVLDILEAEKLEVLEHYKDIETIVKTMKENAPESFAFKAYRHADVKQTIVRVFNKKCAYCEVQVIVGAKGDVEHFRPKGRINLGTKNAKGKAEYQVPGYYWLASAWDNLLLSCNNCNSPGTAEVPDETNPEDRSLWKSESIGKADHFPILKKRILRHIPPVALETESPLLLNPRDPGTRPETHFQFHHSGLVLPKAGVDGETLSRAKASIKHYGLNRNELVGVRGLRAQEVNKHAIEVKAAHKELKDAPSDMGRRIRFLMSMQTLEQDFTWDREFLAVARTMIQKLDVDGWREECKRQITAFLASGDEFWYLNNLRSPGIWALCDRIDIPDALRGPRLEVLTELAKMMDENGAVALEWKSAARSSDPQWESARLSLARECSVNESLGKAIEGGDVSLIYEAHKLMLCSVAEARVFWNEWIAETWEKRLGALR